MALAESATRRRNSLADLPSLELSRRVVHIYNHVPVRRQGTAPGAHKEHLGTTWSANRPLAPTIVSTSAAPSRRYGFHGLSYEYIVGRLASTTAERVIVAHLGNGASLVALRNGRPLDTTMGLTPIGGLMMGTRSGDLDPGVLLYLMREKGHDATRLERLVSEQAGLLGVSNISSDMKTLLVERARSRPAADAVEMFCHAVRKHIGGLAAVLGGLDLLVFTGGIGERAAPVRWEICQWLDHLGVHLDARQNAIDADTISTPQSPCAVRVIPTDEGFMIARHTRKLLAGGTDGQDHH